MIRFAVIGSGWVISNRHIPSLSQYKNISICSVVGRQVEKLKPLAVKYNINNFVEGNAIENSKKWIDECDAVTIGTDPLSHYEIAKFCLQKGKHVLMEKPMTMSVEESQELVDIAKKKKRKFAIVHNFQFSDCAQKLDRDLANGRIGKIKNIFAFQNSNPHRRLPTWYEDIPLGLFYDESPHLLYLIEKYAPGSTLINSTVTKSREGMKTPAMVNAQFVSKENIPVNMSLNFEARISEWFFIVYGANGTGLIDIFRDIYMFLPDDGLHKPHQIIKTSVYGIWQHSVGTMAEIFKVLRKKALFEKNSDLGPIDAAQALSINKLQWEIINKSKVM
jgi:scyllo-inositol 2-dehydrogenase (NADP+)